MDSNVAAIRSTLGAIPGLVIHESVTDAGEPWATVTWPACEFILEVDDAGAWQAHETYHTGGCNAGSGATPATALNDALMQLTA